LPESRGGRQGCGTVTLNLARKQFQAGYVNYLALLNAEQAYQQAVRLKPIAMRTPALSFKLSAADSGTVPIAGLILLP
jgi:hypothetical protein